MTAEYKKDFLINILYIGVVLALIVVVSKYMMAYFFPFIIGVIVALAVQNPARGLSAKFSIKKQICAVVLTILICVAVLTAAGLCAWALGSRLARLIGKIPVYFAAVQDSLNNFKKEISGSIGSVGKNTFENVFSTAAESFVSSLTGFLSAAAAALIGGLPTFLIGSIVTVVASCYIAKDFDRLKKFALGIVSENTAKKIITIKNKNAKTLNNGIERCRFLFFSDIIFCYPKKFVPLQMNTGRFSSEFRQWDIEGIKIASAICSENRET